MNEFERAINAHNRQREEGITKHFVREVEVKSSTNVDDKRKPAPGEGSDLKKSVSIIDDYLEKGGKKATIGEIRDFGKRKYIKTVSGWKYHGKGTGAKAKAHKKSASKQSSMSKKQREEHIPKPKKGDRFKVEKLTTGEFGLIDRESGGLMESYRSKESALKDMDQQNKKSNSMRSKTSQKRIDRGIDLIDQFEKLSEQEQDLRDTATNEKVAGSGVKASRAEKKADTLQEKMNVIDEKIQSLGQKMTQDERDEVEAYYGTGDLFDEPLTDSNDSSEKLLPKSKLPKKIDITFGDWVESSGYVKRNVSLTNSGTEKDEKGNVYTKIETSVPWRVTKDRAEEIKGTLSTELMSKYGEDNFVDSELKETEYGTYHFEFKIKEDY